MAAGHCSRLRGSPPWEKPDRGPPLTHTQITGLRTHKKRDWNSYIQVGWPPARGRVSGPQTAAKMGAASSAHAGRGRRPARAFRSAFDARIRQQSTVRRTDFTYNDSAVGQQGFQVRVDLREIVRTGLAVFSGRFAFIGDTAFADLRDQLQKQQENNISKSYGYLANGRLRGGHFACQKIFAVLAVLKFAKFLKK